MKICVFGAGYVGLVTAACLAEMGNSVVCRDVDALRVADLNQAILPIHEPGLRPLVERNMSAGRLRFTDDAEMAVAHGTLVFIAVGTPSAEDGSADVHHVLDAAGTVGRLMCDYKVVIGKSTVPVGTADRIRDTIAAALALRGEQVPFAVVSNPEFLREGEAVGDFMRPDRVVVGCADERAAWLMRALYAPFLRNHDRLLMMDVRSAELTKYAANAMLASRISFMNEMALLAEALGADIEQLRLGLGSDHRIGTHFLYAGCGWGGSCFPKDVKALAHMAEVEGVAMPLLEATREVNRRQRRLLVDRLLLRFGDRLDGHRFAVWGLSFKAGTDDLREAPAVEVVEALVDLGATVGVYDPVAGSNARMRWSDRRSIEVCDRANDALDGASALLVMTEWREFRSPDFEDIRRRLKHAIVLDGRNLYDPAAMTAFGFEYQGIGRGTIGPITPAWMADRVHQPELVAAA